MSQPTTPLALSQLQSAFHSAVAAPIAWKRRKAPPPFSLRLSTEERERLKAQAGNRSLGAYIRARVLGEQAEPRRHLRHPGVDHQKLALVLAALGQSRLSSNINQLAKASNMGTLDISPDTEKALQTACAEIIALRQLLIEALGLKAESDP